jgi:hypothetical protein
MGANKINILIIMNKGLQILQRISNPILREKFLRMEKQEQYNIISKIPKKIKTIIQQDPNKNKNIIMNSKNILYVCDFSEYNKIDKTIVFFQKCNINIICMVLHNKTIFLTNNDKIKIVDKYRIYDLNSYEKYMLDYFNSTDTIIITSQDNSEMENICNNFKNAIIMSHDKLSTLVINKKIKIFINFRSVHECYGGGNQFVNNIHKYLEKYENMNITYELEDNIDIYLIIDPRKDKNGFKKYSLDDIVKYRNTKKTGKIIYRINDCDITRKLKNLENSIMENINDIDCLVYNSDFIQQYYYNKYQHVRHKMTHIIYNSVDSTIFFPKQKLNIGENKKFKIVTHHWSDNINKGYDIYFKLAEYCKMSDVYEFIFIGRKFNSNYDSSLINVVGPFSGMELADKLRNCDIYITASKYDSCPMHVLEGLSCGLPMLYSNNTGGVKNICEITSDKVGEKFVDFDDLINKLEIIKNNYDIYYDNILRNINFYNSNDCYTKYLKLMYCLV